MYVFRSVSKVFTSWNSMRCLDPMGSISLERCRTLHWNHQFMWITVCDGKFQSMENSNNRCAIATFLMKQKKHWKSIIEMDDIIWYHICRLVICRYPHLISAFSGSRIRPPPPPRKKDGKPRTESLGSWNHRKIHRYSIFWLLASKMILLLPASCARCADDKLLDGWIQRLKELTYVTKREKENYLQTYHGWGYVISHEGITGPFATRLGRWTSLVTKVGYVSSLESITSSGQQQFSCPYKGGMDDTPQGWLRNKELSR